MARVTAVAKAQKDQGPCGKCRVDIKTGDAYRWTKLNRFSGRKVRCAKSECSFKQSDLTSNDKLSQLYAAQEAAHEALDALTSDAADESDFESILEDLKGQVEEVKDQFEESAQNIEDGFNHETAQSEELREKASELESWASDIESVTIDGKPAVIEGDPEPCEECKGKGAVNEESGDPAEKGSPGSEECGDCGGSGETDAEEEDTDLESWFEEACDEVREAIDGCPL